MNPNDPQNTFQVSTASPFELGYAGQQNSFQEGTPEYNQFVDGQKAKAHQDEIANLKPEEVLKPVGDQSKSEQAVVNQVVTQSFPAPPLPSAPVVRPQP